MNYAIIIIKNNANALINVYQVPGPKGDVKTQDFGVALGCYHLPRGLVNVNAYLIPILKFQSFHYHVWTQKLKPCTLRHRSVFFDLSLTVKAAPHECVIRTYALLK